MRKNWLKKIIPLTLSAGIMVGVPAFTQPVLPVGIASVAEAAAPVQWNVGKDLAGWKFGGVWAYSGEPEVAADSAFGGSIRVGTDFSNNVNDGWSEVKLVTIFTLVSAVFCMLALWGVIGRYHF